MLGTFQQSHLRIEIDAPEHILRESLICPDQFQHWLWPQTFSPGLSHSLHLDEGFSSYIGPITIQHRVDRLESNRLRLILSQGIDGYHEWLWGEGWVQSTLEGISILPLNLGQTLSLWRLRQFVCQRAATPQSQA